MPVRTNPVTVVAVTHDSEDVLEGFLGSLPDACRGIDEWRVVVVDNASGDATLRRVQRHAPDKTTTVRRDTNDGYGAGVNAGIAASGGTGAVLVCNPDVRLATGAVSHLVAALDAEPRAGIAVPRLHDTTGKVARSLRREPTVLRALGEGLLGGRRAGRWRRLGEVVTQAGDYDRVQRPDWASGAVMLIARDCLDAVGPWDESFFLYSEETDYALRARDAGFHVRYEPEAVAVHVGGRLHTSPWLWQHRTLNRLRLYARRHGRLATAAFWLVTVLNEALRAAAGSRPHRAGLRVLCSRTAADTWWSGDAARPATPPRRSHEHGRAAA